MSWHHDVSLSTSTSTKEFTLLKWPPQSPDLNPIEHLWDVVKREIRIMDVQPTNQQQLHHAIMSIWTKISEECFQHLVESIPQNIKAVLKAKGGPTRYMQGVPNKVASECIYVFPPVVPKQYRTVKSKRRYVPNHHVCVRYTPNTFCINILGLAV